VSDWSGIVQVAAGYSHTVGLKSDGTVMAEGVDFAPGQFAVSGWSGIVQVAAGVLYMVGLKADGSVVAVGNNVSGQCNVSSWNRIGRMGTYDWPKGKKQHGGGEKK
jgi:alpha-tubulin suppressor-like RCC1 family protein